MIHKSKRIVYAPDSSFQNPLKELYAIFRESSQIHALAYRLFLRNLKGQYRQSLLGILWSIVPPLITSLIWIFLNSQRVVNIEVPGVSYPIFVIVGTTLWQTFAEAVNAPLKGANSGKSMLSKINFPRESLLLTGLYETIFNLIIKVLLVFVVFIALGHPISFMILPGVLSFIPLLVLGFAIGTILVPFGMLLTDVQRGLGIVLQFAIYLTPVIYPSPKSGLAEKLMQFNPVAPLLNTGRNLLVGLPLENWSLYIIVMAISVFLLLVGLVMYRLSMNIIIERVG